MQNKIQDTLHLEKELFHGTKPKIVDSICKENFDWRLSGENVGTLYGQGSYFALNASYSDNYAKPINDDSHRVMFLANVLVGCYVKGDPGMKRPPPKDRNDPKSDLFDSCVDDMNDPKIFVIFEMDQCYPAYVINYIWEPQRANSTASLAISLSLNSSRSNSEHEPPNIPPLVRHSKRTCGIIFGGFLIVAIGFLIIHYFVIQKL